MLYINNTIIIGDFGCSPLIKCISQYSKVNILFLEQAILFLDSSYRLKAGLVVG